jgi:hypothetical protein
MNQHVFHITHVRTGNLRTQFVGFYFGTLRGSYISVQNKKMYIEEKYDDDTGRACSTHGREKK